MARVKAFRGLRPPVEIVEKLASRPYDVLNSAEARIEAAGNPYSLLHVTKAEIDLPEGTDEHSQAVYDKVVENFNNFKKQGWLVKEDRPKLYIYAQTMDGRTQYGIVGCTHSIMVGFYCLKNGLSIACKLIAHYHNRNLSCNLLNLRTLVTV